MKKMNVLHMARWYLIYGALFHKGTVKIMLNHTDNEVTNIKIKKKTIKAKINIRIFLHVLINFQIPWIIFLYLSQIIFYKNWSVSLRYC